MNLCGLIQLIFYREITLNQFHVALFGVILWDHKFYKANLLNANYHSKKFHLFVVYRNLCLKLRVPQSMHRNVLYTSNAIIHYS